MSGSTIGGVVGAFVGYFVGSPQLGWMIGSAIGGYVDPEQVSQFGPRLTDASQQTARDGIPIAYGYGTFPCHGNLIWCSDITEHVNESTDDGKGSGVETTTTTYSYTRSYAIGICQGEIAGLLQVKRNGKVVWDARTDAEIEFQFDPTGSGSLFDVISNYIAQARAFTSRFSTKLTIYTGSETQTADPTIEAHEGVGNVPGHRGLAYIVVTDDDVTELRGAVPQYEFVVRVCGEFTGYYVEPGAWVVEGEDGSLRRLGVPDVGDEDIFNPAGTDGHGLAMGHNARHVWTITSASSGADPHTLSKFSTVDGSLLASFAFDSSLQPRSMIESPDGEYLYIALFAPTVVAKFGTTSGEEISRTSTLNADAQGLAISPDGETLYATVSGVAVIDTSDMSHTTVATGLGQFTGCALRPDGGKLVACRDLDNLYVLLDTSDLSYTQTTNGGLIPRSVCYAPDGLHYYLGKIGGSPREVLDATDGFSRTIAVPHDSDAVAINMNGDLLYVLDVSLGTISTADLASNTVVATNSLGGTETSYIVSRPLP